MSERPVVPLGGFSTDPIEAPRRVDEPFRLPSARPSVVAAEAAAEAAAAQAIERSPMLSLVIDQGVIDLTINGNVEHLTINGRVAVIVIAK